MVGKRRDRRADLKHLFFHHSQIWVRIGVPPDVRDAFDGKTTIMVKAGSDISAAKRIRDRIVPEIKKEMARARRGASSKTDDLTERAMLLKEELDQERRTLGYQPEIGVLDHIVDLANDIRERHGDGHTYHPDSERKAEQFFELATGRAVSVASVLERFKREHPVRPKSEHKRDDAYRDLLEYKPSITFQRFTRRDAGDFVAWMVEKKGYSVPNANSRIWPLSTLWKWAAARGYCEDQVWSGQSLSLKQYQPIEKRAYSDAEVLKILSVSDGLIQDTYLLLFLTGARISEICQLRVKDCEGGWFEFRGDLKTKAARRKVFVHPELREIVERRSVNPEEFLLSELGGRSTPHVKRLSRFRRQIGLDIRPDGQPQSEIDTHSARRWFVQKALQAGNPLEQVKFVVGHAQSDVTLDSYHRGAWGAAQIMEVVESVKLP